MHISEIEIISKLSNKRRPRRSTVELIKTKCWLLSLQKDFDITYKELDRIISSDKNESSGTTKNWFKGTHAASKKCVEKINSLYPGSNHIYKLPIFELIENKPITDIRLNQLIKPYIMDNYKFWCLPENINQEIGPTYTHLYDTDTLFQRGDFYSFIATLYLVRKAENRKDIYWFSNYMKEAYRCFPAAMRSSYFNQVYKELYQELTSLQLRMLPSINLVHPKKDVIYSQIKAKQHITMRSSVPRNLDHNTVIACNPELPYFEAKIDFQK